MHPSLIFRCWTVPASRSVEHRDVGAYAEPTTNPGLLFRNDIHGMEVMQSRAKRKFYAKIFSQNGRFLKFGGLTKQEVVYILVGNHSHLLL